METIRFDDLTRSLESGISRRKMLRAVIGGTLTLGLGRLALDDVGAHKKHKKRKKHKRRSQSTVIAPAPPPPPSSAPPPVTCPDGTFRFEDRCALSCGIGCTRLGGVCLTTIEDVTFCGAPIASCADIPTECRSHAECGAQEFCAATPCISAGAFTTRCVPIQG